VYNLKGDFLGTTKEGFTGQVMILMKDDINVDYSECFASELGFKDYAMFDEVKNCNSLGLSPEAMSKIWTHIAKHFEGMSVYGLTFTMTDINKERIGHDNRKGSYWHTDWYKKGKPGIKGTGNYKYESTVENIASSIILHEWYGHIKMGYGDDSKSHYKVYSAVMNFKPLWEKNTKEYKTFNCEKFLEYIVKEKINLRILNNNVLKK